MPTGQELQACLSDLASVDVATGDGDCFDLTVGIEHRGQLVRAPMSPVGSRGEEFIFHRLAAQYTRRHCPDVPGESLRQVDIAPGVPVMDAEAASPTALAAIKVAAQYLGTSYHFGGASPETGFDCSGLMQWAYSHAGVSIPRVTYDQIDVGAHVDRAQLVPGDLIFFQNNGDVHHVGMYLGGGRFLHAPHTGDVVKVSSLDEPYYAEQFAGGRRMA